MKKNKFLLIVKFFLITIVCCIFTGCDLAFSFDDYGLAFYEMLQEPKKTELRFYIEETDSVDSNSEKTDSNGERYYLIEQPIGTTNAYDDCVSKLNEIRNKAGDKRCVSYITYKGIPEEFSSVEDYIIQSLLGYDEFNHLNRINVVTYPMYFKVNWTWIGQFKYYYYIMLQDLNGESYTPQIIDECYGEYGSTVLEDNRNIEGFEFYYSDTKGRTIDQTGNTKFHSYYIRKKYTLTFKLNGGTTSDYTSLTQYYDSEFTFPRCENENKKLGRWQDTQGIPYSPDDTCFVPAHNEIYTAYWDAITTDAITTTYTVNYVQQGIDGQPDTIAYTTTKYGTQGEYTNVFADEQYPGFITPSYVENKIIEADGKTVVEIYYSRDIFTIEYYTDDGNYITTNLYTYGQKIEPSEYGKAGYELEGWYSMSDGTKLPDTMPARNLKVKARYTPSGNTKYIVRHYYQNADASGYAYTDEDDPYYGTTGTTPEITPKLRTGYEVLSYSQEPINGDGSTVYEIEYRMKDYEIQFIYNGNSMPQAGALTNLNVIGPAQTVTYKYGQTINFPPVGHTNAILLGWSTDIYSTTPDANISDTMPAENLVLYAVWLDVTHTPGFSIEIPETNASAQPVTITQSLVDNRMTFSIDTGLSEGIIRWYFDGELVDGYGISCTIDTANVSANTHVIQVLVINTFDTLYYGYTTFEGSRIDVTF